MVRPTMSNDAVGEQTEGIEMPNGTVVEKKYKCADCSHVSDSYNTRFDPPRTQRICERCGKSSLMVHPGDVLKNENR